MNTPEPDNLEPHHRGSIDADALSWSLAPLDARVLDALADHAFDSRRALLALGQANAADAARLSRLSAMLSVLEEPTRLADASLVDAAMARVLTSPRESTAPLEAAQLSHADAALADAIAFADIDDIHAKVDPRARQHAALADLLACGAPLASPGLVDRTMDLVRSASPLRLSVPRLSPPTATEPARISSAWRLRDIVGVAAMLVLGASVILPVLASLKGQSLRANCMANLGAVAQGLSRYALSNNSPMPMATAGFSGAGSWWDVGVPKQSNSANLFTLVSERYVRLDELACPGNPFAARGEPEPHAQDWRRLEEISYSYQIAPPRAGSQWPKPDSVVLADRSPIVPAVIRRRWVDPLENSPNHSRRGQHLMIADGSVAWLETPVLARGDNIWLPRALERRIDELRRNQGLLPLNGVETPDDLDDVMLGP